MKKLFTFLAVFLAATGAFAQAPTMELECSHLNIYMTSDTVRNVYDEEGDSIIVFPWSGNEMAEGLFAAGLPISGYSSTDLGYVYAFRNDYKDPETGFEVKKGYYRGIFVDGNLNMFGDDGAGNDHSKGYTNLRKVILYFVGLPQTWLTIEPEKNQQWVGSPFAISHQDYPTGRVYAQYNDEETGAKISNSAYREVHVLMSKTAPNDPTKPGTAFMCMSDSNIVYNLPNFLGYTPHASKDGTCIDPRLVTYDQPFKLTVWVDNSCDEKNDPALTDFQTRTVDGVAGEKGEWNDVMIDGLTEAEIKYYFGDITEQNPYWNEPDKIGNDCTTGRNTVSGSWSRKLPWTSSQPISWGVKKRMVLIGVSMVSGSPQMPPQHVNAGLGQDASIEMGEGTAYGSNPDNEYFAATTEKIDAGNAYSDRPYLRTDFVGPVTDPDGITEIVTHNAVNNRHYNIAGQEVSPSYSGLHIVNGRKVIIK